MVLEIWLVLLSYGLQRDSSCFIPENLSAESVECFTFRAKKEFHHAVGFSRREKQFARRRGSRNAILSCLSIILSSADEGVQLAKKKIHILSVRLGSRRLELLFAQLSVITSQLPPVLDL